jgi:hypothetical protein
MNAIIEGTVDFEQEQVRAYAAISIGTVLEKNEIF